MALAVTQTCRRHHGDGSELSSPGPLHEAADATIDRLVPIGYSRIGYAVRRPAWESLPTDALAGKVALVTGANSGLGKATAAGLTGMGAQVHMLVRNRERGEAARDEIAAAVPGARLHIEECDVSRLGSVRDFVADFRSRRSVLHVLVHNAGVLSDRRVTTEDGNEVTLATHVLGPFLLTSLLTDELRAAAAGRVIWVSSGGMYAQRLPAGDLQYRHGEYRGAIAYARTKRMQVILAEQWAQQLPESETVVHSMHPGWAATAGVARSLPGFYRATGPLLRTPEQGADTIVWLAASDTAGATTGRFWHDRTPRPTHYLPSTRETPEERNRLWHECARLTAAPAAQTTTAHRDHR